ncbi:hypothetical protein AJ79_07471 [Helicocarpus griseus UAMH5409]|uniref:Uncharacterized protein n=1 Tax=Helicocarpus griseus UAMH5409 TaxID=1447875 RepID=A0A2B7X2C2_9EURO|nr:hypothetical protein AJ79_07471 [Helicocarpus griseus UAMH5409]
MPPLPGEERLVTVFVDVHYYFSPPSPRPPHHRFDKGSYLYIYHDAAQQKARIEIANNPGTAEQDAFYGSLGTVHLRNSNQFPTLCTLTVDAHRQNVSGPSTPSNPDQNEWLLANVDPRDGSRTFLRLHTLDLYFWTLNDATLFYENAQKVLTPSQLDITPTQLAAHEVAMSPVVQKLENVAITDPAYHNGQTRNSRTEHTAIQQPAPQQGLSQQGVPTFAPPPTQAQPQAPTASQSVSPLSEHKATPTSKPEESQVNYTPLAYNPSAPAAPEPIKPREKTPPPPDAATGTGLATAALSEHGQAFAPPPMSPGFPPPPPGHAPGYGGQYGSPPSTAGLVHTPSISSHTSNHNTSTSMAYAPPPAATQAPASGLGQVPYSPGLPQQDPNAHLSYPPSAGAIQAPAAGPGQVPYSPGLPQQDPNAHLFRQQSFGPPPPSPHNPAHQHYQGGYPGQAPPPPQPPIGGYSNYSYGHPQQQQQQQPAPSANPYDVHHQVYRPTEAEGTAHYTKMAQRQSSQLGRGVGKFLKKLDQKF